MAAALDEIEEDERGVDIAFATAGAIAPVDAAQREQPLVQLVHNILLFLLAWKLDRFSQFPFRITIDLNSDIVEHLG